MRLFLVRHGQTDHNLRRVPQVGQNPPLNAAGVQQSQQCSAFLNERLNGQTVDAVYCSSLQRALQTAEILLRDRPEPEVYKESTSLAEGCLIKSMKDYIGQILSEASSQNYANILIVSHSSVIKYMVQWLAREGRLYVPPNTALRTPKNASLSEMAINENGEARLVLYNAFQTAHK